MSAGLPAADAAVVPAAARARVEPLLRLGDSGTGPGAALLRATQAMGFSREVAAEGLGAELEAWRDDAALGRALARALGGLSGGLPGRPSGGLDDPALAPRLPHEVLVIAARTLPASTLREVFWARLLGARVRIKPAKDQEAVAQAIAAADREAIAVTPFAGGDDAALGAAVATADAVVALGSDETVASVRARVPRDRAFLGYGHRVSAAWCARVPSDDEVLGLARDLCAWDQSGCLSPQVVWVAGEAAHEALAARLAGALQVVERALPMRLPAGAVRARRVATTLGHMQGRVWETRTAAVVALPQGAFRPSPGYRLLWVLPADPVALSSTAPVLSSLAYVGDRDAERASASPPLPPWVRVCAPGQLQRPPLDWLHDGLDPVASYLRPPRREEGT